MYFSNIFLTQKLLRERQSMSLHQPFPHSHMHTHTYIQLDCWIEHVYMYIHIDVYMWNCEKYTQIRFPMANWLVEMCISICSALVKAACRCLLNTLSVFKRVNLMSLQRQRRHFCAKLFYTVVSFSNSAVWCNVFASSYQFL